ncbi:MAG: hypothetical protein HY899_09595 [Deltaproteobacteria bacterium]|nr:hypothetical protein [Deltaproteobacteria bacterium]
MNTSVLFQTILGLALLSVGAASAQAPPAGPSSAPATAAQQTGDLQSLKAQMLQMQTGLRALQAEHRREVADLKAQVQNLHRTIANLRGTAATPGASAAGCAEPAPATSSDAPFPTGDASVVAAPAARGPQAAAPAAFPTTDASVTSAPPAAAAPRLTGPITIAGGARSVLNISFDGQFSAATSSQKNLDALEVGDHDPQQRGFNARNLELALDGAVDPYFEGFANVVFKLDNDNETSVEVEEAFMQTTTLPWNLQAKGGQFFAPLGRVNQQHPHAWDFVDAPLVSGRLLGPDGLRGTGAQVAWLTPLPWYSQLSLAVQNGNGGTGYSFRNGGDDGIFYGRTTFDRRLGGVEDLVFVPRLENSVDLSPTQTLLVGASGAFGPNDTGTDARTEIYGVDVFYKWKSAHSEGGWPFVKWQSEALMRRFEAGRGVADAFPVGETFDDWGAYSQIVWGFRKGWTGALRTDFLHMEESAVTDDPQRQSRWRLSPNVTWFPTEFSKFRLQYNHDFLEANHFLGSDDADSLFLQFEFSLGAHAAHKF